MGGVSSKKTPAADPAAARHAANRAKAQNQVSAKDKAILELKASRDRLKKYQKQLEAESTTLEANARQLLAKKQKDRAMLCLKMRKFKLQQIAQADTHLLNVHTMIDSVEWETQQLQIFEGLKAGNSVLDAIHKEMTIEAVEDLMLETQEAQAHADEISRMLGGALTVEDEDAVLAELAEIERGEAAALEAQLPIAPDDMLLTLPEAPTAAPEKPKKSLVSAQILTPHSETHGMKVVSACVHGPSRPCFLCPAAEPSLYGELRMKPSTPGTGPAIHLVKIEWLKPHEAIVSRDKIESLTAATLSWGGYLEPLLVDRQTGAILDGHHRYTVGLELQLRQLPVILVDYLDDASITVHVWPGSRLQSLSKQDVVLMALSPHTFPPKSSQHKYPFALGKIAVPLRLLEDRARYAGMYAPASRHVPHRA
ncbi:hydroxymethylglutaryl-CoA lyase, mitochondrial precursor [Achlya hypogyna]|uniref:Hydroxymethylglutaryl-CoA lyase, mitochondrial n=1 Tax=Achlya hypogyna TaxID=1202772 RepID=A0A1V9Z9J8_ACHHY|nr:hydroxymethylglutaryl-CoA lyase, mitochondrial precursor [Achlya hypogyna]